MKRMCGEKRNKHMHFADCNTDSNMFVVLWQCASVHTKSGSDSHITEINTKRISPWSPRDFENEIVDEKLCVLAKNRSKN